MRSAIVEGGRFRVFEDGRVNRIKKGIEKPANLFPSGKNGKYLVVTYNEDKMQKPKRNGENIIANGGPRIGTRSRKKTAAIGNDGPQRKWELKMNRRKNDGSSNYYPGTGSGAAAGDWHENHASYSSRGNGPEPVPIWGLHQDRKILRLLRLPPPFGAVD